MADNKRCPAVGPSGVQCDRTLVGPLWHPYPHRHEYAEGPINWVEWSSTNSESYVPVRPGADEKAYCWQCDADAHHCPSCGQPLSHGVEACEPCVAALARETTTKGSEDDQD